MPSAIQPRTIRVKILQQPSGLYEGTSPDLNQLNVTEQTAAQVQAQVPNVIRNIFKSMGQNVTVSQSGHSPEYTNYLVTPQ